MAAGQADDDATLNSSPSLVALSVVGLGIALCGCWLLLRCCRGRPPDEVVDGSADSQGWDDSNESAGVASRMDSEGTAWSARATKYAWLDQKEF